jgi:hypothetical protein
MGITRIELIRVHITSRYKYPLHGMSKPYALLLGGLGMAPMGRSMMSSGGLFFVSMIVWSGMFTIVGDDLAVEFGETVSRRTGRKRMP